MIPQEVADNAYRSFCEGGHESHPLQDAWDKYEEAHGSIQWGSDVEELVRDAVLFGVRAAINHAANEAYDEETVLEKKIKALPRPRQVRIRERAAELIDAELARRLAAC